jgi:hypothetical protein
MRIDLRIVLGLLIGRPSLHHCERSSPVKNRMRGNLHVRVCFMGSARRRLMRFARR